MLHNGELSWCASPGMPAWPFCPFCQCTCRLPKPGLIAFISANDVLYCKKPMAKSFCYGCDVLQSQLAAPQQFSSCSLIHAFIRLIVNTQLSMHIHLCIHSFGYFLMHSFDHSVHSMSSIIHAAMALQLGLSIGCMALQLGPSIGCMALQLCLSIGCMTLQLGPSIGCMALQVHQGRPHRAGLLHPDCQCYPARAV